MCGIIAYSGHRPAVPIIMEGLSKLEYRGYDSAGVAFTQNNNLSVVRSKGKLTNLEAKLEKVNRFQATCAVGHTRWATHGLPVEKNAHPHQDHSETLALVHNGIIENYQEIKKDLLERGCQFRSDTDTEVLVQLISFQLAESSSVLEALCATLARVEGSYAFALIDRTRQGKIWAGRKSSPLLLGIGQGENFVASDVPAFLKYTREVVFLDDMEIVEMDQSGWQVYSAVDLSVVPKKSEHVDWEVQAAEKSGYKHFMLKEIFEQPRVIRDCMAGRCPGDKKRVYLPELDDIDVPARLHIVACGTSYHAGLWAKYLIEEWARIPVQVDIASEFRYRSPVFGPDDVVLAISQSGETADTLAGIGLAKEMGVKVIGLCNVVGSSVSRESDIVVYTQAGPEISVASTKAMCSQQTVLLLLALYWSGKKGSLPKEKCSQILKGLAEVPQALENSLSDMRDKARFLAKNYAFANSFFFLGRGINFPLALEGALKLKEISYIHAEGYASGEMKHGPIALIEPDFPTFAVAPDDRLLPKVVSNLQEVKARDGKIISLSTSNPDFDADHVWIIPFASGALQNFFILPALQLFAYEMAVYLGQDVDQPRNLAKSVTVE